MLRGRRPVGMSHPISLDFDVPYSEEIIKQFNLKHHYHQGIDFACAPGTPCEAYKEGYVQLAGEEPSYGKRVWLYIDISKEDKAVRALYAHLSQINVQPGQKIKEGELIGLSGHTGKSSGPHLHFEIRELPEDVPIQPLFYMEHEQ